LAAQKHTQKAQKKTAGEYYNNIHNKITAQIIKLKVTIAPVACSYRFSSMFVLSVSSDRELWKNGRLDRDAVTLAWWVGCAKGRMCPDLHGKEQHFWEGGAQCNAVFNNEWRGQIVLRSRPLPVFNKGYFSLALIFCFFLYF